VADDRTQLWIRNESDVRAQAAGCRFDEARGAWTVWWIERYCRLYEGEWAGAPLVLRGAAQLDDDDLFPIAEPWGAGGRDASLLRAQAYCECVAAGDRIDWQYEVVMRLFGWVRWSARWKRWVRRFTRGNVWIPKKNKKSPTLAAIGLYLTIGDGEQGQHVYFGAKDGNQARKIMGEHARAMVEQSPELSAACKINQNLMRISHQATRSYMEPLSSSNKRNQQAKEGYNGSMLVDERHVVDLAFLRRVKRAGISRAEPFCPLCFSTVGIDSPEIGAKAEYDRGKLILAGTVEEQATFVADYAVPQELTDEQLAAEPLRWGAVANPAWGHTIDPEEFLSDMQASKVSLTEWRDFWMYRLNRWALSTSPWLALDDWMRGAVDGWDEAALEGRDCWGGLDMSRTRDLTAFCLAFPEEDDVVKFLWWFWLPEDYARQQADKAPFLEAAEDPACHLTLIPGPVIDVARVRNDIRGLSRRFRIRCYAYDDWNAEVITQEISEGVLDPNTGQVIEPGLDIERINFSQAIKAFNEATKEFERRVLLGQMQHAGDPFMAWQMQHASLREDSNGNIKPVKPGRDAVEKVEGPITGIMAFDLARRMGQAGASVYDTRGVLEV